MNLTENAIPYRIKIGDYKGIVSNFKSKIDNFYNQLETSSESGLLFNHDLFKAEDYDSISFDIDQEIAFAKKVGSIIEESISEYLNGNYLKSYELLMQNIEKDKNIFECFIESEEAVLIEKELKDFYRVRITDKEIDTTKIEEELFHIPFDKRHLVSTQRYSMSGYPCLYLGKSISVCLNEIGEYDLDKHIYIANFKLNPGNQLHFFDLIPLNIAEIESMLISSDDDKEINRIKYQNKLKKYIKYWPLYVACYLKIDYENQAQFKEEYIVPQLVYQWIFKYNNENKENKEKRIDGICYLSNNSNLVTSVNNYNQYINYVLPPKTKRCSSGICKVLFGQFIPKVVDYKKASRNKKNEIIDSFILSELKTL